MGNEPPTFGLVLLKTTIGDISIELFSQEAPKATRNFVQLCLEGYYDNCLFYRVEPGISAQTGDASNTGKGGKCIYEEGVFEDEYHPELKFNRGGLVGSSNNGNKNSNKSQFFLTLESSPGYTNRRTLFGKISKDSLANVLSMNDIEIAPDSDHRPITPPMIQSVIVVENPFQDLIPKVTTPAVEPEPIAIIPSEISNGKRRESNSTNSIIIEPGLESIPVGELVEEAHFFEFESTPIETTEMKEKKENQKLKHEEMRRIFDSFQLAVEEFTLKQTAATAKRIAQKSNSPKIIPPSRAASLRAKSIHRQDLREIEGPFLSPQVSKSKGIAFRYAQSAPISRIPPTPEKVDAVLAAVPTPPVKPIETPVRNVRAKVLPSPVPPPVVKSTPIVKSAPIVKSTPIVKSPPVVNSPPPVIKAPPPPVVKSPPVVREPVASDVDELESDVDTSVPVKPVKPVKRVAKKNLREVPKSTAPDVGKDKGKAKATRKERKAKEKKVTTPSIPAPETAPETAPAPAPPPPPSKIITPPVIQRKISPSPTNEKKGSIEETPPPVSRFNTRGNSPVGPPIASTSKITPAPIPIIPSRSSARLIPVELSKPSRIVPIAPDSSSESTSTRRAEELIQEALPKPRELRARPSAIPVIEKPDESQKRKDKGKGKEIEKTPVKVTKKRHGILPPSPKTPQISSKESSAKKNQNSSKESSMKKKSSSCQVVINTSKNSRPATAPPSVISTGSVPIAGGKKKKRKEMEETSVTSQGSKSSKRAKRN